MIQNIFYILHLLLRVYSFIIFIRIIFSWFHLTENSYGRSQSAIISYLYKLTDPYLNWFRRFSFLRIGVFDFSAMLGIVALYFLGNIFLEMARSGAIGLTYLLTLILSTLWSFISSVIVILAVLLIVRVVFIYFNKYSQIFYSLDGYIEPYVRRFSNIFTKKFTPYKTNLIILITFLIAIFIAGTFLIGLLQKFIG